MWFREVLMNALNKQVVVNGITAEQVKDKLTGVVKGGVTITAIDEDYITIRVHNVKAEYKSDKLIETIENIHIPIAHVESIQVKEGIGG